MFTTSTPQWGPLYDALRGHTPGTVIAYDALTAATGLSIYTIQRRIGRAIRELERTDQRTVVNVPGVGYRVAHAGEHIDLARRQLRLARRRVRRGGDIIEATNLEDLTCEERDRLERTQDHAARVAEVMARRVNHAGTGR